MPPSERIRELVAAAREGDAEAFGVLYDLYVEAVFRFVHNRVSCPSLAEDLTSETFLRALRGIAGFSWQGRDFDAWLVTIARNLILDHYKSSSYRLEVTTPEPLPAEALLVVDEGPETAVISRMTSRILLTAVHHLGSEQQECVVLRFLHGLSVAETAQVMGKKSGAIKALQHRAVRSLARMLPSDAAAF
jgi:RNA polymerase sigma-70 factor (ECF subfamily)